MKNFITLLLLLACATLFLFFCLAKEEHDHHHGGWPGHGHHGRHNHGGNNNSNCSHYNHSHHGGWPHHGHHGGWPHHGGHDEEHDEEHEEHHGRWPHHGHHGRWPHHGHHGHHGRWPHHGHHGGNDTNCTHSNHSHHGGWPHHGHHGGWPHHGHHGGWPHHGHHGRWPHHGDNNTNCTHYNHSHGGWPHHGHHGGWPHHGHHGGWPHHGHHGGWPHHGGNDSNCTCHHDHHHQPRPQGMDPAHAFAKEQLWELTHIFAWVIGGTFLTSFLFLAGMLFACCRLCSARRPTQQDDEVDRKALQARAGRCSFYIFVFCLLQTVILFFVYTNSTFMDDSFQTTSTNVAGYALEFNHKFLKLNNYPETFDSEEVLSVALGVRTQILQSFDLLNSFFSNLSIFFNAIVVVMFMFVTFITFGACARRSGPLMIFSVLALFFAGGFCLFWMDLGVPSSLLHHNCHKVERSFVKNQSSIFPGIQMAGLLYRESDHFTDFESVQENLELEGEIDINSLYPEQEHVFQLIRSCVWEGDAKPELLQLLGLTNILADKKDVSRRLVISINNQLEKSRRATLPATITPELVSSISWGPAEANQQSMQELSEMIQSVHDFKSSSSALENAQAHALRNDVELLSSSLNALRDLIDLSDCSYWRQFYAVPIRENLCHGFVENVRSLSCFFGLLCVNTIVLFFLSFCAGQRVLSRLERLESSDYSLLRSQEQEEDDDNKKMIKTDANPAEGVAEPFLVQEKTMPVYDRDGNAVHAQNNQLHDLVYIPPPVYFYNSHHQQPSHEAQL